MKNFALTAVAVLVGIWIWSKLQAKKMAQGIVTEGEGFEVVPVTIDAKTGASIPAGNGDGTVGFASGPIDNFKVDDSDLGQTIKY